MARYLCKSSVTMDKEYLAGEEIELTDKQAKQLLACVVPAIELAPAPAKSESPKSGK